MSRRESSAWLLAAAVATACGQDEPIQNELTSGDAGVLDADAGALDAPKPAQPTDSGPDNARPHDAARESSTVIDAGSDAPAPECDGGGFPSVTDAAAPRMECVPPCLWEIWKYCPPPGYMGTPDYRLARRRHDGPRIYQWGESVYANGCFCYGISHTNIPPSLMMPMTSYSGGGITAVRMDNNPSSIYCGFPPSGPAYTINLSLPECAPWRSYY